MANFDDLLNNSPAEEQAQLSKEDYAAKKKAERDAIFELCENTTLEVAGNGDRFREYLDVQSKFDRYSAVNTLLILAQKPEATRLGSYDFWKDKGGYVKTGQIGISILEPHDYTKEDGTPGVGYNIKKVFDISQVDARKVKAPSAQNHSDRQLLQALIHKAPVQITGVDELPDGLGAMTDHDTGEIFVLRGMEFADSFRSVAQELAYADLTAGPNMQANTQLSAYSAAYILCKKYGVDTQAFSFDAAPAVFEGMETQEVKGELAQIRDVAEDICGRMTRQLESIQKAAKEHEAR